MTCKGCRRITYCSPQCRKTDANPDDNDDTALGHSALVCSLLRLCNLDEAMEDKCENCDEDNKGKITQEQTKGAKKKSSSLTKAEKEEAAYRVRSEYESYPATLAFFFQIGSKFAPVEKVSHTQYISFTDTFYREQWQLLRKSNAMEIHELDFGNGKRMIARLLLAEPG